MRTQNPEQEKQVRDIATHLGSADWSVRDASGTPDEWHDWRLTHGNGYELSFDWPTYPKPGRLSVHGVWPKAKDGTPKMVRRDGQNNYWTPSITVAATKSAAQIAKDIARRLLPEYLDAYREAAKLASDADSYADQTAATVKALLAVESKARGSHQSNDTLYLGSDSHGYMVRASGDSVRFEAFSVPLAVAKKLLPLLRKQKGEE